MDGDILRTSADELYELVKSRGKISIEEAAKALKMPAKTVHALVDFLVEEKIFGIEYKFTTPFIYISEEHPKEKLSHRKSSLKKLITKEEFFEKAKNKDVPFQKINELWNKYLGENLKFIKEEFYSKARSRNMGRGQIDDLWEKYLAHLR